MIKQQELEEFINTYVVHRFPLPKVLDHRMRIGATGAVLGPNTALHDSVVFIADRPTYFFTRMSIALRKRDQRTVLLTRWGIDLAHASFFDEVILYDSFGSLCELSRAINCRFFVQSWLGWNFLPWYIHQFVDDPIVNFNDLGGLVWPSADEVQALGFDVYQMEFDRRCEREALGQLKYITPYSGMESFFPCWPCPEFFAGGRDPWPTELLFMGNIPDDQKPTALFGDAKLGYVVSVLLGQGFGVTLFNDPTKKLNHPMLTAWAQEHPRLHFLSGYPPWELKHRTRTYRYGLMLYDFDDIIISPDHYSAIVPSKFFTYMEQLLPVLVSEDMSAVAVLVRSHGLGVVVPRDQMTNLDELINPGAYESMTENISAFRQANSMDSRIDELMDGRI